MHILVSSFRDGEDIIPVKLVVKEFDKKDNGLYVTVALDKINEAVLYGQSQSENRPRTSSEIRLTDLLREVKSNEGESGPLGLNDAPFWAGRSSYLTFFS